MQSNDSRIEHDGFDNEWCEGIKPTKLDRLIAIADRARKKAIDSLKQQSRAAMREGRLQDAVRFYNRAWEIEQICR